VTFVPLAGVALLDDFVKVTLAAVVGLISAEAVLTPDGLDVVWVSVAVLVMVLVIWLTVTVIVADAAYAVFSSPSRQLTGRFLIDDTFLAENGVSDFEHYRVDPSQKLAQDFFVPADIPPPKGVNLDAWQS